MLAENNGRFILIDYKTKKAGYKESVEKNLRQLEKAVCNEPEWEESSLAKQFTKQELQLPFYWWLLKKTPAYENVAVDVALQFVRPAYQGGCQLLILDNKLLEEQKATFEKILLETLLPQIIEDTTFKALGSNNTCSVCDYNAICERGYVNQTNDIETLDEEGDQ